MADQIAVESCKVGVALGYVKGAEWKAEGDVVEGVWRRGMRKGGCWDRDLDVRCHDWFNLASGASAEERVGSWQFKKIRRDSDSVDVAV